LVFVEVHYAQSVPKIKFCLGGNKNFARVAALL
jgi:hypothetical protein